jgi:hypothetical protein
MIVNFITKINEFNSPLIPRTQRRFETYASAIATHVMRDYFGSFHKTLGVTSAMRAGLSDHSTL